MKTPVALLLALLAGCATETSAPVAAAPPPAAIAAAPAPGAGPLRIVVVHWKIRPGMEQQFLDYWSTRATVADRSGLVSEYLSSTEDARRLTWINWSNLDPRWTSYFNVGLWRDEAAFQDQIGRFIDNNRPPLEFEAARRERIFLAPERWRVGRSPAPAADPAGVR